MIRIMGLLFQKNSIFYWSLHSISRHTNSTCSHGSPVWYKYFGGAKSQTPTPPETCQHGGGERVKKEYLMLPKVPTFALFKLAFFFSLFFQDGILRQENFFFSFFPPITFLLRWQSLAKNFVSIHSISSQYHHRPMRLFSTVVKLCIGMANALEGQSVED